MADVTSVATQLSGSEPSKSTPAKTASGWARAPRLRRWPRRARRGIIGVVLSMAIIAVVLLGLLSIYNNMQTSTRTMLVQTMISNAQGELRRAYASQPEYEAELTEILLGVMPNTAIRGTGANREIVTPWGGAIVAGGGDTPDRDGTGTASYDRFYITILDLPEAACEELAQAFLGAEGVIGVFPEGTGGTDPTTAQTTPSGIAGECDGGGDDALAVVFF